MKLFLKRGLAVILTITMTMLLCYVPKDSIAKAGTLDSVAAVDLVTNGGFETGLTGWDNWSNSSKFGTTTEATEIHTGSAALKVTSSSQDWVGLSQDIFVTPNTDYTLTFYGKNTSMFCVKVMSSDWSTNLVEQYPTGTGDYSIYTYDFNSGSNTKVILYISDSATDGSYDDFSIMAKNQSTEPTVSELINNGGFEDDMNNWSTNSDIKFGVTADPTEIYEGSKALKVSSISQDWKYISQEVTVEENTDYSLTFYEKGAVQFSCKVMDASWSTNLVEQYPTGSAEYTKYTYNFNSGTNTKVVLYISDSSSDTYYDSFSMVKKNAIVAVPNGDFETGNLSDWANNDAPAKFTITSNTDQVHGGQYSLAIVSATQDWANIKLPVHVKANYKYKVSFYSKGENTTYFKVLSADATAALAGGIPSNTASDWTLNSYEFSTGSNENVILYFADTAGAVYIDDISIEEIEAVPQIVTEVTNGDFETGDLTGWDSTYGGGKFTVGTVEGGNALKITSTSQDWKYISQTIPVEQGTNYNIALSVSGSSIYYKIATNDWGKVFGEGTTIESQTLGQNTSNSFNTGSANQIMLVIYDATGDAVVDDVTIQKVAISPQNGRNVVDATGNVTQVDLVDSGATGATKSLFAYLKEVGDNYLLFGHQNDNYQSIVKTGGIASDTYHTVGAYSAISGFDIIDVSSGSETADDLVALMKDANAHNSIVTLSDHMNNFTSGGGYGDMTPTVANIMPGGKDNAKFLAHLDIIAEVANAAKDINGNKIPIIFRPFHENSGMWFWWGVTNTTKDEFVNLWRYTVEYLRDDKGVDNFLYAYSPNGHFSGESNYLSRYPGDAYVDIIGFDVYQDNPSYDSKWMQQTLNDARIAVSIANSKNKVAAITEAGPRYNGSDGLAVDNNTIKNWYMLLHDTLMTDPEAKQIAYMMTWRNQDKTHFWVPYDDGAGDRHEMADEFTRFYNQDDVVFSDRVGNAYSLLVSSATETTEAYIVAPITAEKIKGTAYQVKIKVVEGNSPVNSVTAMLGDTAIDVTNSGEYYVATVDTTKFTDGDITLTATVTLQNSGVIELSKNIKVMNDEANDVTDVTVLDNYDGYYGDNDLLTENYNRNTNGDVNSTVLIASPFGEALGYALKFDYSVATGGPGYSGVSKTVNYDISSLNATGVSLWFKGDGLGKDILLQLNMPDCFEVHFNDLADFDPNSTDPQYLEIPWSSFVKKGHTNAMDLSDIQTFAFYINGSGVDSSTLIFDEIKFMYPVATPTQTPTPTPDPGQTPTQTPTSTVTPTPAVEDGSKKEEVKLNTGDGEIGLTYTSKPVDNKLNVTLEVNAEDIENLKQAITVPVSTQDIIKELDRDIYGGVTISIAIPDQLLSAETFDKIDLQLDSELLKKAKEEGKDVSVTVKDQNGQERYTWTFDHENLQNSTRDMEDINLSLNTKMIGSDELGSLLGNDKLPSKYANNLLIDFAHDGILAGQASLKVFVGKQQGMKPGDNIYLYHINSKTGKLDTLPYSSKYAVDSEGYITVNIVHCSDYVAMTKKADTKLINYLKQQISVAPLKETLYISGNKKSSTIMVITLPSTLELVKYLKDQTSGSAIGAVKVKYYSNNNKVVTIDKEGKITAVGGGKATITTKLTLYSGKVVYFKTTITVKKKS